MPWRTDAAVTLLTTSPQTEIALVGDDLYSVLSETDTLGFVYKVGNVFVSLSGRDFGRAVEVGQSLDWDRAVALVQHGS